VIAGVPAPASIVLMGTGLLLLLLINPTKRLKR